MEIQNRISVVFLLGSFGLGATLAPALALGSTSSAKSFSPTAYIYNDTGADREGSVSAAVELAHRNGMKAVHVSARTLRTGDFSHVGTPHVGDVWIQPGGDAIEAARAMGPEGLATLRGLVYKGMNYLGFCAGAFLADRTVDDANTKEGLGLLPFPTADQIPGRHESMMVEQIWEGVSRWIYFQDGATFQIPEGQKGVETIAVYEDGHPSVIQTKYGEGRVVLSGAHPEATASWAEADHLKDLDGPDTQYADELAQRVLAP